MDAIERLGEEIGELSARVDAATQRLLACIRQFDEAGGWQRQGAISCAHWLAWRIGLDTATARERCRVARALGSLPHIDEAFARGELSYAKVRAMTRVATPANEARLLELARNATGAQLERICRGLRQVNTNMAIEAGDEPPPEDRCVRERHLPGGHGPPGTDPVARRGRPDPAGHREGAGRPAPARPRDAADVSAETSEAASAPRQPAPTAPSTWPRPSCPPRPAAAGTRRTRQRAPTATRSIVHLDQDVLAPDGADGRHPGRRHPRFRGNVPPHRLRRRPGAHVHTRHRPSATGAGAAGVLDIGRRTRTIPAAIRRALWVRDRGCRFPGCPHTRFLHGHHIRHWLHGGSTSLDNLVLLCPRHHRMVHEDGFAITVAADGALVFRSPRAPAAGPQSLPRHHRGRRPVPAGMGRRTRHRNHARHEPALVGRRRPRLRLGGVVAAGIDVLSVRDGYFGLGPRTRSTVRRLPRVSRSSSESRAPGGLPSR